MTLGRHQVSSELNCFGSLKLKVVSQWLSGITIQPVPPYLRYLIHLFIFSHCHSQKWVENYESGWRDMGTDREDTVPFPES